MQQQSRFGGLSQRSARLIVATIVVGLVHHLDHVLRYDHSVWPFRPEVTPFTFSLLAYPILLFALFGPLALFWTRWGLLALGMVFTLYAHSMIETPMMQYAMWAQDRSLEMTQPNAHNLLDIHSSLLGAAAVGVAMLLNLLLVASVASMFWDGMRGQENPAGRFDGNDNDRQVA